MFCVMNIQKRKRTDISGIQKEATRTATEYNNQVKPGMNIFNVNLIQSNNWMQTLNGNKKLERGLGGALRHTP